MEQKDLLTLLNELAPTVFAASWDNSGLQVAQDRQDIHHIAVCLDPSTELVHKALTLGADFIFTHHPLKLSPCYPNKLDAYHKILSLLFTHKTPLYSAHTNLDSMPLAHWLADEFSLVDRVVMERTPPYAIQEIIHANITPPSMSEEMDYGIGSVGSFEEPISAQEFIQKLQNFIPHTQPFHSIGSLPQFISRIAICGGSGSSLLKEAKQLGAEVFITGDIKYHSALDFKDSLNIPQNTTALQCLIDVGHFSLEEEMMRRFSLFLEQTLKEKYYADVRVTFIPSHDPFALIKE